MAYFSNGSEGEFYEAKYCDNCVHGVDRYVDGKFCPILDLHLDWNYDAVGKNKDKTKEQALDALWPRAEDGIHNAQCAMFYPVNTNTGG